MNSGKYYLALDVDGKAHAFGIKPSKNPYGYWQVYQMRKMEMPIELTPMELTSDNDLMEVIISIEPAT